MHPVDEYILIHHGQDGRGLPKATILKQGSWDVIQACLDEQAFCPAVHFRVYLLAVEIPVKHPDVRQAFTVRRPEE